jgi:hypothetical protein
MMALSRVKAFGRTSHWRLSLPPPQLPLFAAREPCRGCCCFVLLNRAIIRAVRDFTTIVTHHSRHTSASHSTTSHTHISPTTHVTDAMAATMAAQPQQSVFPKSHVGFDSITTQIEKKLLKRGFQFNVICVGMSRRSPPTTQYIFPLTMRLYRPNRTRQVHPHQHHLRLAPRRQQRPPHSRRAHPQHH